MIQVLQEILRQKRRLVVAVAVLLLANLAALLISSQSLAPAVSEAQTRWNDLRRRVAALGRSDVGAQYRQAKVDIETFKTRIPAKRQFPRVLGDILEAAAASGVSTGAMSYKPQVIKDENLLSYGITMSVGGSYAAVKSFLADLLKNPELIVVDGLTLSNADPYEESVTMDLRLTVYLRGGA